MSTPFPRSGPKNPCPVCDRTKDGDCRILEAGNQVLCHTLLSDSSEGQQKGYKFLHATKDNLWGVWIYQKADERGKISGFKLPRKSRARATYYYSDRQGQNLVMVRRVGKPDGSKDFYQFKWDGVEYKPGINDFAKRNVPIYRYAEVREAIAQGKTVFFVEGEGKADRLWEIGIPATTTLGGSKGYRSYGNYFEDLKGASLVLCPDRDKVGLAYMDEVAKDFPGAQWCYVWPDSPIWRHLPDDNGLDVADWLDESATVADLLGAVGEKRAPGAPREVKQAQSDDDKLPRLVREYRLIQEEMGGRIRLNTLTQEIELDGKPTSLDKIKLDLAVDHGIFLKSSREDVQDIICKLAEANAYSPVREYLESCYQRFGGDTSILESVAEVYFGQTAAIYNTFVIRTLIGAVARAYDPGCKQDTALILQGKQGYLKSSWFKTLCGAQWFDDSLGAISDKDERLKLHRSWFVEWAELETIFTRKDVAATKAFLTCSVDHVRPPYARSIQSLARHSVIVGTTNKDEFLSDPTGNRRFWVIPCLQQIPLERLKAERDRLWGAAVALYKAGEQWFLSAGEELAAAAIAEEFQTRDPWQELISSYVDGRPAISTKEILGDLLKIEAGRQEKSQLMRVADILRALGWTKAFQFYSGRRQKVWLAPQNKPDPPDPPRSTLSSEVDRTQNASPESVSGNCDPPDPPFQQHLPKTVNGHSPDSAQQKIDLFSQIGGSGGSGGSEVDRAIVSGDPPLIHLGTGGSEVDQVEVGDKVQTPPGVGQVKTVATGDCYVEGEDFYGRFDRSQVTKLEDSHGRSEATESIRPDLRPAQAVLD